MTILKFHVGLILSMFLSMVCIWPAVAETVSSQKHRFRVVTVVEGLEHPWSLTFLPDGGMLVTERPGRLRLVRQGRLDPQPVAGFCQPSPPKGKGGCWTWLCTRISPKTDWFIFPMRPSARGESGRRSLADA